MTQIDLTTALKVAARRLGFDAVGVCPAVSPTGITRFYQWIADGYGGQMHYLADRSEAYEHPRHVLDGVRSLVMLTMNYYASQQRNPSSAATGIVSRYAWGKADYHDVVHERLRKLVSFLQRKVPTARARGVVDTAPLLEREFAQLAGLGWIGKNTLLLRKDSGSWFFLAALLTDVELEYDTPFQADHCGACRACLDACPTRAFPQPYVLDATRCISYLTIELRDMIPTDLRDGVGDWLFGCDVCQEVCPWNHRAPDTQLEAFEPAAEMNPVDLCQLFTLTDDQFRQRFRATPLWRAKRRGILRNAALVLGNHDSTRGRSALRLGLSDIEPLVRAASAWALGQHRDPQLKPVLAARLPDETNHMVRTELQSAIRSLPDGV